MKILTPPEALHKVAAYCSTAERCPYDVNKKLTNYGILPAEAEKIIERLKAEKFLDEERYCRFFVSDKLRFNQWGKIKIAFELKRKELPANVIRETLNQIDQSLYTEMLEKVIKSKLKSLNSKEQRTIYPKLFRFAAVRGFESEMISKTLQRLLKDFKDAEDME